MNGVHQVNQSIPFTDQEQNLITKFNGEFPAAAGLMNAMLRELKPHDLSVKELTIKKFGRDFQEYAITDSSSINREELQVIFVRSSSNSDRWGAKVTDKTDAVGNKIVDILGPTCMWDADSMAGMQIR